MTTQHLAAVAAHEAGHAYAAVALDVEFRHVSVIPGPLWDGVLLDVQGDSELDQALVVAAGPIAQAWIGFPCEPGMWAPDSDVFARLVPAIAARYCLTEAETIEHVTAVADRIVTAGLHLVHALARQLLRRQEMPYTDVVAFLSEAREAVPWEASAG